VVVFIVNTTEKPTSSPSALLTKAVTWGCWTTSILWCILHMLLGRITILPMWMTGERITTTYMRHAGLIQVLISLPGAIMLWILTPSECMSVCGGSPCLLHSLPG
jgi:hypothetical protein